MADSCPGADSSNLYLQARLKNETGGRNFDQLGQEKLLPKKAASESKEEG
jgi:hypothetical protein